MATNKAAHDVQHQEELTKRASTVVVQPVTEAELRSVQAELAEIRAEEQRKRAAYERDLEEVRESARALQKELGDGYVVDIP